MPGRAGLFVCLGFAVALVFVTGISAGAESDGSIREKKDDVASAQDRLMEIRTEASAAGASYNNALYEMNQLNGQIARTKDDLDAARKRSAAAKTKLEERATQVYKSRNVAFMDVLVGVDNFSEFASRLNLWVRLLAQDRDDLVEVREARNDLAKHKDKLVAERQQRVDAVERAVTQKKRADEAEAQAEAYLNSLNAGLRDAIQAAQHRRAEQARTVAAAMVETAPEPGSKHAKGDKPAREPTPAPEPAPEPIPEIQASEVKQAPVPRPDLSSEQAAADREAAARASAARAKRLAEQRAAERKAAREAAKQAAVEQAAAEREARLADAQAARQEARRQAERAAERAAERRAARQKAERQAERAAEQAAIEEAAAEQAAAERAAARRAAERREEQLAAERKEARQEARAAEASASASAAAAERAENRAAEASASASVSAPTSQGSRPDGSKGGRRDDASASASAASSASASGSPAGGGGASGSGADVIAVAEQHLGTPYVLSPPGPCSAFEAEDCSCFTMLVFQEFGIALPDSPGAQMGYGIPVRGAPQAGDLLFWSEDGSGTITHVGIAMGDGTTIHASNYAGEVTITSINYVNGYVGARRLL